MHDLVARLHEERRMLEDANREKAVARQHEKGKLTARERIAGLLDTDSFSEIGGLVRSEDERPRSDAPADGLITGFGRINDRPVAIMASDFTIIGGSSGATGSKKSARLNEYCLANGHPYVALWDGGGHRIQEGLDSRHFAFADEEGAMRSRALLSGWVPTAAAILGPGFAGPANSAALSDFVVITRKIAQIGVAGPALVNASLKVSLNNEELGGADLQAENGIVHLVTDTEEEAFSAIRRYLSYFPSNAKELPPRVETTDPVDRPGEELLSLVPASGRRGYDIRKVIRVIADQDSVFEIRPTYAKNMVTALARIGGIPVGIVANQPMFMAGTIDAAACEKATPFITTCDAFGLPLIFLIDTPGFFVGPAAEKTGLARRVGNIVHTMAHATVPRFSLVLRKAYGLGYVAMGGGRSFEADLALAWPSAEISAMSVPGAVDIAYRREIDAAADPAAKRTEIIDDFMKRTGAIRGAEGFGIDDVIDPRETRFRLWEGLKRAAPRRPYQGPAKFRSIAPI